MFRTFVVLGYFCSEKDRAEFLTNPNMSVSMRPPL